MKYLAAFALAATLSATALPQDQPAPQPQARRGQARRQMADLKERLKLTDEQMEKVRPILAEQARKAREIREKHLNDRRAARQELRNVRDVTDAKLKEVLTKDQFAEYEKFRAERRRR